MQRCLCTFCNFISKSVSRAIFDTQLLYFIRKLVILVILDRGNVVFVSVIILFLRIAKTEKIARSLILILVVPTFHPS